jgi:membrane protein
LNKFLDQTAQLPSFSIFFSIVTGIVMVLTLTNIMNSIWKIKETHINFLSTIIALSMLFVLPLFLGLSIFASTKIFAMLAYNYQHFILNISSIVLNSFLLGIIYTVLPNKVVHFSRGLMGGFIAALLFEISKKLFELYITFLTSYEFVYGTLAIIPIFLLWLYVAWSIILFGALFTYAYQVTLGHGGAKDSVR